MEYGNDLPDDASSTEIPACARAALSGSLFAVSVTVTGALNLLSAVVPPTGTASIPTRSGRTDEGFGRLSAEMSTRESASTAFAGKFTVIWPSGVLTWPPADVTIEP